MWQGSSRADDLDYPDLEYQYYLCAKEFGWTIKEFDEQPAYMATWVMAITQLAKEVENGRER